MKKINTLIAAASLAMVAGVHAAPVSGSGLQGVLNGLYTCATCDGAAPHANLDQANEVGTFVIGAGMGSFATMVIEMAGNAGSNILGIYDPYSMSKLQLFGGSATSASQSILMVGAGAGGSVNFTNVSLSPLASQSTNFTSNVFGYYLETIGGTFYSQNTLNQNDNDHMLAYQGNGSDIIKLHGSAVPSFWSVDDLILAWEDLAGLGDGDYNDMVVYVSSVRAVPEPGSLALLGLGLAGLAAAARRKSKRTLA